MIRLTDYPLLVFAMATLLLALSAWFGAGPLRRWRPLDSDVVDDFRVVQGAMLTLLGLIIGFAVGVVDMLLYVVAQAFCAIARVLSVPDRSP